MATIYNKLVRDKILTMLDKIRRKTSKQLAPMRVLYFFKICDIVTSNKTYLYMDQKSLALTAEKVSSTTSMTHQEVKEALLVILFSYWKKMILLHRVRPEEIHLFHSIGKVQILDERQEHLATFGNVKLGKQVYDLLKSALTDSTENVLKRIMGRINQDKETSARNMLTQLLDEHSAAIYPWPWGLDDDGAILVCRNGTSIFFSPIQDTWGLLRKIIEVKATANPKASVQKKMLSTVY